MQEFWVSKSLLSHIDKKMHPVIVKQDWGRVTMTANTALAVFMLPDLQISSQVASDEGAAPQHDGLLGLHTRLAVATQGRRGLETHAVALALGAHGGESNQGTSRTSCSSAEAGGHRFG